MAVEYPSYGIYKNKKLTEAQIQKDAVSVFEFVQRELKVPPNKIIILGRSMGSGPASFLASRRVCGAFLLFSPYQSIKRVAKEHAGCLACFAPNIFDNKTAIASVKAPTFIVHGKRDTVIDFENSEALFEASELEEPQKMLLLPNLMTHNHYRLETDFLNPSTKFLRANGVIEQKNTVIRAENFIRVEDILRLRRK